MDERPAARRSSAAKLGALLLGVITSSNVNVAARRAAVSG